MIEGMTLVQAPKRWMTPDDLQEEFDISKSRQATLRSAALIPYSKRGKFIFYDRGKIDKWLEDAEVVA